MQDGLLKYPLWKFARDFFLWVSATSPISWPACHFFCEDAPRNHPVEKLCIVCGACGQFFKNILLLIALRLGRIPARVFDAISNEQ
jgi:hypothetical protein